MKQQGFTLIELIVVIVILGILAAIAMPKFVNLQTDAQYAAVKAVAGAVASAGEMNYARMKTNSTLGTAISDTTDACAGTGSSVLAGQAIMFNGSMTLVSATAVANNEYQITGGTHKICSIGGVLQCIIISSSGASAVAYVPCTN